MLQMILQGATTDMSSDQIVTNYENWWLESHSADLNVGSHIRDFVEFACLLVRQGIDDKGVKEILLSRWKSMILDGTILTSCAEQIDSALNSKLEDLVWGDGNDHLTLEFISFLHEGVGNEMKAARKARGIKPGTNQSLSGPAIFSLKFFQDWLKEFTVGTNGPLTSCSHSRAQRVVYLFRRVLVEGVVVGLTADQSFDAYLAELKNTDDSYWQATSRIEEIRQRVWPFYETSHCLIAHGIRHPEAQRLVLARLESQCQGLPFSDTREEVWSAIVASLGQLIWMQGDSRVIHYVRYIHPSIAAQATELQELLATKD